MQKRAVGYIRVSTQMQVEEGISLEAQKANLEEYCERNNMYLMKIYKDAGLSGRDTNRPELRKLIIDSKKKEFDIVLVWKISRISRNLKDLLTLVEELEKNDIALISCTEPFDTSTHLGKAFLQILGTFAELERNTLAENVKMSLIDNAKKGKWNGGIVYGYDVVEGQLFINEDEAEIVKKIYDLYIKGWGYSRIRNELNKLGIKTKKDMEWNINQVERVLKNPIYTGIKTYNKVIDKATNPRNNPNEDKIIITESAHVPIISREQFELVQRIRKSKYRGKKKGKNVHLLSGILKCPYCGAGMVSKKAGGGKSYINYYQCSTYHNNGGCRSFLVNEEKIESAVLNHLKEIFTDENILKFTLEALNNKIKNSNKPQKKELKKIEQRIIEKEQEMTNLINFIAQSSNIDYAKIEEEIRIRQDEIRKLKRYKVQKLQRLQGVQLEEINIDTVLTYARKMNDILMDSRNRKRIRHLIETVISEVRVNKEKELENIKLWFNNFSSIDNSTVELPLNDRRESKGNSYPGYK